jgi:hypothetical protein
VRSLLDGLSGSLLALALAAAGWVAIERAAHRGDPSARNTTGQSSESRRSPSRAPR